MSDFKTELKSIIKKHGITGRAIAEATELTEVAISNTLRGHSTAEKIIDAVAQNAAERKKLMQLYNDASSTATRAKSREAEIKDEFVDSICLFLREHDITSVPRLVVPNKDKPMQIDLHVLLPRIIYVDVCLTPNTVKLAEFKKTVDKLVWMRSFNTNPKAAICVPIMSDAVKERLGMVMGRAVKLCDPHGLLELLV